MANQDVDRAVPTPPRELSPVGEEMTVTPLESFPPLAQWDDWVEYDAKAWPRKVERHYMLVPTICFNCEAACGLVAYVDKQDLSIRKLEGNPYHPGSRGRNCAKGPATLNQIQDPERILFPLKRVGPRGSGKFERTTWDHALDVIGAKIRKAILEDRRTEVMYHVGRPGHDGYMDRVLQAWGVDGHNSHTNVCSAAARLGYALWQGADRPSPDHANAKCILLLSSHLETGHYFNPHAQRIIDGKLAGAKLIVIDVRLSNTASMADHWLAPHPGSEAFLLLAFARVILEERLYDESFLREWVNWREFLAAYPGSVAEANEAAATTSTAGSAAKDRGAPASRPLASAHPVSGSPSAESAAADSPGDEFSSFLNTLRRHYARYTPEAAEAECGVPRDEVVEVAREIGRAGSAFATHVWRNAASGNHGGWQVARCLEFLSVLVGAIATKGGTNLNTQDKFVPAPFAKPPPQKVWNELLFPREYPLAHHELSYLLPHFLMEGRGKLAAYFTRVYNPVWTNPDGMMWERVLRDESKVELHAALTPVWSETAQYADFVLPMGLGAERHDLMSQETHAAKWIGFRQPVLRLAKERLGERVEFTWQANPGEVWEEDEFWIALSWRIDPDGSLGIRKWFESPYRPGERITAEEYYRWIFENSVPGLPDEAKKHGLSPLDYMRRFGAFLVQDATYEGHRRKLTPKELERTEVDPDRATVAKLVPPSTPTTSAGATPPPGAALPTSSGPALPASSGAASLHSTGAATPRPSIAGSSIPTSSGTAPSSSDSTKGLSDRGTASPSVSGRSSGGAAANPTLVGVIADGEPRAGVPTPSRRFELWSSTMVEWGWPEHAMPGYIESHVHPRHTDPAKGDFVLVPTFRLPTLIHTRSGNSKWLYELSNSNPVWIHPRDAERLGVETLDLVRVTTRIGYFVNKAWVTEGVRPGVVACSHHLGRWRLFEDVGTDRWASALVKREELAPGRYRFRRVAGIRPWQSRDPDSSRIWWTDGGVHQNLTFPVQPDPISGMHCWHQLVHVAKAPPGDRYADVEVDTSKSMEVYREWLARTRSAPRPQNLRRPLWLNRAVRPAPQAYQLP